MPRPEVHSGSSLNCEHLHAGQPGSQALKPQGAGLHWQRFGRKSVRLCMHNRYAVKQDTEVPRLLGPTVCTTAWLWIQAQACSHCMASLLHGAP